MKVEQHIWTKSSGWAADFPGTLSSSAQLVLVFGSTAVLQEGDHLAKIRSAYPGAYVLGCSTAGEIASTRVLDDSIVVTAAHFEHAHLRSAEISLNDVSDSREAGQQLARCLDVRDLAHVFVLSDGLKVNGSELVEGLNAGLPKGVSVTGGLSGDGARFRKTLVCFESEACEQRIVALGFYGSSLRIGCAGIGGWDSFGPDRLVTRSRANVLYELDGQSALSLYKTYLGEHAQNLPSSGLLFPLSIRGSADLDGPGVVRTILSVDEAEQSMTFAGDIREGCTARLMRSNFERLIDGAQTAARTSRDSAGGSAPALAILISCVGRKLVLKQRIEEEVEAVRDMVGPDAVLAGFYSYGEICPLARSSRSELHNQTMTVTTFAEDTRL